MRSLDFDVFSREPTASVQRRQQTSTDSIDGTNQTEPMSDDVTPLDRLQIFFGDCSAAEARVYALLPADAAPAGCTLSGVVIGPQCALAHTLDATAPLIDRGLATERAPATLVAEALIADPCFWSPDLPMLYKVRVELRRAGERLAAVEHSLGIRPLGTRGRRLLFGGRPYVLRGVLREGPPESSLPDWREATTALVVDTPEDNLCREASRQGVLLVAWLRQEGLERSPAQLAAPELTATVRRLGRWPAVVVAVFEGATRIDAGLRSAARNLLFAQYFGPGETVEPAAWADLVLCEDADATALAVRAAPCPKPVVAVRRAGACSSVAAARNECDLLQRDLAGRGDFAAYIV